MTDVSCVLQVRQPDSPRFSAQRKESKNANKYKLEWQPPLTNGGKEILRYDIFYDSVSNKFLIF